MVLDVRRHKNEKYLYLKMGYTIAKSRGNEAEIVGNTRNETRYFEVVSDGRIDLLHEIKYVRKGVMARRTYDVYWEGNKMVIADHIDSGMVNRGKTWDDRFQFEDAIKKQASDSRGIS